MNVTGFLQALVGAVIVILVAVTAAAYMTLIERRLLARFQVRRGPNRVGPFGFLQPLADAVKLVFKGEYTPMGADRSSTASRRSSRSSSRSRASR